MLYLYPHNISILIPSLSFKTPPTHLLSPKHKSIIFFPTYIQKHLNPHTLSFIQNLTNNSSSLSKAQENNIFSNLQHIHTKTILPLAHMGFHAKTIFVFTVLLLFGCRENLATRPLEGEEWLNNLKTLVIQSLQRGPVTPSGSNPCTYIPGGTRGRCTLAENESNYSGHVGHAAPPAFPGVMVKFAPASTANDSRKQDGSS